ncbi:hypothetical protein [Coxiella burnetii]|nr:hypothetical protein [Coxiella burnetii]ACJ20663.1 hypothetical protein CbuK_1497 [Coxiella burnetii CbuK_Q154]EAX32207.1 hypothetical protein A35_07620 [Coxiella burnetii 'MSU Goat Q177']
MRFFSWFFSLYLTKEVNPPVILTDRHNFSKGYRVPHP